MPDALQTLRQQLASVRAAIQTTEAAGQAREINGRSTEQAKLDTLYAREKDLLNRIDSAKRRRGLRSGRAFGA
jgi:hypothetical protein